jgi:hypothetical protein
MLMRRFGLQARGGPLATVRMIDAQVGGQTDLSDVRLTNPTGATPGGEPPGGHG